MQCNFAACYQTNTPRSKILGPSQQHCHFTSVHPTLTSSHLNTWRKLAALSRQWRGSPPNLQCQHRKQSLQGEHGYGKPPLNLLLQGSGRYTFPAKSYTFLTLTASSPSCWARLLAWWRYHRFLFSTITPLHAWPIWRHCWQLRPACKPCNLHGSILYFMFSQWCIFIIRSGLGH